jgi:hypothetical protein
VSTLWHLNKFLQRSQHSGRWPLYVRVHSSRPCSVHMRGFYQPGSKLRDCSLHGRGTEQRRRSSFLRAPGHRILQNSESWLIQPFDFHCECDSFRNLNTAVSQLSTSGCTPLGPALCICAGFISEVPNSEIVLCTDGAPNEGVGSLSSWNQSEGSDTGFYRTVSICTATP